MKFLILLIPLFFIGCMSKSVYMKIEEGGTATCSASVVTGNADCMMQGPLEYQSVPKGEPNPMISNPVGDNG